MKKFLIFLAVLIIIGVIARWIFVLKYGKEIMEQSANASKERKKAIDDLFRSPKVKTNEPSNTGFVPPVFSQIRGKGIETPVYKLKNF